MNTWAVPGYTETRELGAGGSGRVVLAVHDATGIPVAVKYLGERLRRDTAFVRKFQAEARLLGGLESPYVVQLYEYVEAPEGAAIVMELVDGVALGALLAREGRTGPEAALAVLKGSLLGLAEAHRAGVVHRDYKPGNVLVAADGTSKLVDFGIATGRGTTPGVAGTPAYMAPEQWSGEPASPSADVYAATATFFECVTGRRPYTGQNFAELALQHTSAPIPDEEVPPALRPLVRHGLAKTPQERPTDAEAFVAELERVAVAAYGPDWEERGQRKLAALAALLPLLFPSGGAPAPAGTTALATTTLRPARGLRALWPGGQSLPAGVLALVLGLVLALAARADGDDAGRTATGAVATTSAVPAGGQVSTGAVEPGAPGSASPSASPSASASPSPSAPTTTPDASVSASATASGTPTVTAPPVTSDPPVTSAPPTSADPEPVKVVSVSVGSLRQTGAATAQAVVDVVTDGTGPVTITVDWTTSDDKGSVGSPDGGGDSFQREGATRYSLTVDHTFRGGGCYWIARASTTPTAGNGGSEQRILIRRCVIG
ncbi:serine/threonine-protein kinase [Streptomyces sp. SCSIO 30461]|uniref:serine/threonine-protein kinase n=1 Tax=Streptomyces sp. SCSIO 30461 TaxID=3118085 RepID=UPI0030CCF548